MTTAKTLTANALVVLLALSVVTGSFGHDAKAVERAPSIRLWGGPSYDGASSLAVDNQGNTIIVGRTSSFGSGFSTFVLKLNPNKDVIWQKLWTDISGVFREPSPNVAVDPAGNIYFNGSVNRSNLVKLDSDGNLVWQKRLTTDLFVLAASQDGSVYAGGSSRIVKLDSNGAMVWEKGFGFNMRVSSLAVDNQGNVFGVETSPVGIVLQSLDSSGNLRWEKEASPRAMGYFAGYFTGASVSTDSLGNVYVAGSISWSSSCCGATLVLKFSPAGDLVWGKGVQGAGFESVEGSSTIFSASDGTIYVTEAVTTRYLGSCVCPVLFKYDKTGNLVSQLAWGPLSGYSLPTAVALDSSHDVLVAGSVGVGPSYAIGDTNLLHPDPDIMTQDLSLVYTNGNDNVTQGSGSLSTISGSSDFRGFEKAFLVVLPDTTLPLSVTVTTVPGKFDPGHQLVVTVHVMSGDLPVFGANVTVSSSDGGLIPTTSGTTDATGTFSKLYVISSEGGIIETGKITATADSPGFLSSSSSIALANQPTNAAWSPLALVSILIAVVAMVSSAIFILNRRSAKSRIELDESQVSTS